MPELTERLNFTVPEDFTVWDRRFRESAEAHGFEVDPNLGWLAFRPEVAVGSDRKKYLRREGSQVVYVKTGGGYECVACGEKVRSATVYHPIWDGPFEGAGSGSIYKEENVPYCPTCEGEPNTRGTPLRARC